MEINSRATRRRRSKSAAIYIPLAVLLVLFIGVFGASVFFRVNTIEVTGAQRYLEDEIIEAAGILEGDNLMFIDINSSVIKLRTALPYVSDVKIQPKLPDKIIIEIKESIAAARISSQGMIWLIDTEGRILEGMPAVPAGKLIDVKGITPLEPEAGQKLKVEEGTASRIEAMTAVLKAIEEAGLHGDIYTLDVSNTANITFDYVRRFTVNLGSADDVRFKLDKMQSYIASHLENPETAVGTIDLSRPQYTFNPER